MITRRSATKAAEQAAKAPEVIEILSDSEPEAPAADEVEGADEEEELEPAANDVDQPLLRAARIKYKTDEPEEEAPPQDRPTSPSSAKLAVRTKETGSAKHRHVSIEIPLPTSSALRRRQTGTSEETPSKTPSGRKHITFDDSDHDEFVTPREAPSKDLLAPNSSGKGHEDEEDDEEEDSDDDAPPEAVSTRVAEADTLKAAEAAAKASEQ